MRAEFDVAFREQSTVELLIIDESIVANMNDFAACNCVATALECPASQQGSGEVPASALVCEVGGNARKAPSDVAELRTALGDLARNAERGSGDLRRVTLLSAFDDPHEYTIVERPAFDSAELIGR